MVRRAIAAVVIAIVVVFLVLVVHSCQISQRNTALKDYANNVSNLVQSSDQTGATLFKELSGTTNAGSATALQNQVDTTLTSANQELSHARSLSVPDEMRAAQQNLLLTLQVRDDGIMDIANHIQQALGNSTSQDAVNAIATDMGRFYASDVVYKLYTTTLIANTLNAASINVGGTNGVAIYGGQFLPSLDWLGTTYIASQLHVSLPTVPGAKPAPGVHGHKMDSCSVSGTQLQTSSTNTMPRTPAPTFTCLFTNDGQNPEHSIVVKISVVGTSISGQTVVPSDTPGQQSTATVTLASSPPAGTYTVTATVERVPGETTVTHNTLSYPVTFQ